MLNRIAIFKRKMLAEDRLRETEKQYSELQTRRQLTPLCKRGAVEIYLKHY